MSQNNENNEPLGHLTNDDIIELSPSQLLKLLMEAYRNGYSSYEMVEAGLEKYDPEGYSRYVLSKLKK